MTLLEVYVVRSKYNPDDVEVFYGLPALCEAMIEKTGEKWVNVSLQGQFSGANNKGDVENQIADYKGYKIYKRKVRRSRKQLEAIKRRKSGNIDKHLGKE